MILWVKLIDAFYTISSFVLCTQGLFSENITIVTSFLVNPSIFQACVLVCLILARVGRDGHPLSFGAENNEFLGKGIVVGYAIIVPAVLFTYLLGANLTILVNFKK